MMGKGVLRENSHMRGFSRKKTVNTGNAKRTPGNVVLIDLDDDDVVIIDVVAESSQPKFRTSNLPTEHGSSSVEGVINIDDDEDDSLDPKTRVEVDGDLASDASSSKSRFPAFKTMWNSAHLGTGKCGVNLEKTSAFQFSKCKQTYFTKAPGRNRYGLDPASDNSSTDSDCSDCEIMEDSRGKLREQWERASLKRKHVVQNRHSGLEDQGSASESDNEAQTSARKENCKEQHPEVPVCSSSGNADYRKENQTEFVATDGDHRETSLKPQSERSFVDADQKVEKEKSASIQETEFLPRNTDFQPVGGSVAGNPYCSYDHQNFKDAYESIPGCGNKEPTPKESFKPGGGTVAEDVYCCNECKNYENVCDDIPAFCNEKEPSPQGSPFMSFEQEVGDEQSTHSRTSSREKENIDSGQATVPNSRMFDETHVNNGVSCPDEKIGGEHEDILVSPHSAEVNSEGSSWKACYQDKLKADYDDASLCNKARDQPNTTQIESSSVGEKEQNDNQELICAQDGLVTSSSKSCIIDEREKLKDTEEYKRAIEEEWASRQRELRIQSEEAQRLRKRKKAERRLCDIERRQKQRVEEVRQIQKKDEENISLKEQLRGEIRKEINKLEITCIDMASLLRGLGIQVGGGFHPMSHEVNAAYKRALLKFHPDRASRTDIRQQVEAEEKFKLISRMKEKFLSTSCY